MREEREAIGSKSTMSLCMTLRTLSDRSGTRGKSFEILLKDKLSDFRFVSTDICEMLLRLRLLKFASLSCDGSATPHVSAKLLMSERLRDITAREHVQYVMGVIYSWMASRKSSCKASM